MPEWVADEKANFDYVLDTNQNGRLDESEIRRWLVPDEDTMFDVEARHLFWSADTNRVRTDTLPQWNLFTTLTLGQAYRHFRLFLREHLGPRKVSFILTNSVLCYTIVDIQYCLLLFRMAS